MVENQHRKIKGYRELSEEEIRLMNEIKTLGGALDSMISTLQKTSADPRWIAIGKTNLQHGIMDLARSVAKPEGF